MDSSDGLVVRPKWAGPSEHPLSRENWNPLPGSEGQRQDRHGLIDHEQISGIWIGLVQTNVGIDVFWLIDSDVVSASDSSGSASAVNCESREVGLAATKQSRRSKVAAQSSCGSSTIGVSLALHVESGIAPCPPRRLQPRWTGACRAVSTRRVFTLERHQDDSANIVVCDVGVVVDARVVTHAPNGELGNNVQHRATWSDALRIRGHVPA